MLGQPTWYQFVRKRGHRAPIAAPRYRWACVGGVWAWFLTKDLWMAQVRPGALIRYLPPLHME